MKALFDFLPIILFFAAYKVSGIMAATVAAMVATVTLAVWGYIKHSRMEPVHLFSAVLILVFGGATLYLADERFIKLKPSVLYGALAVAFAASAFTTKPLTERLLSKVAADMPDAALRHLNSGWVVFFVVLAGLNYWVAARFDTDTWVNFKLFGMLGLTFLFVLAQAVYISRWIPDGEEDGASPDDPGGDPESGSG